MGVLDIIDYLMMFAVMLPVGSVIAVTILGGNDLYLAVFMIISVCPKKIITIEHFV